MGCIRQLQMRGMEPSNEWLQLAWAALVRLKAGKLRTEELLGRSYCQYCAGMCLMGEAMEGERE